MEYRGFYIKKHRSRDFWVYVNGAMVLCGLTTLSKAIKRIDSILEA